MTMQGSNRKGVKKFKFMNSNIQILLWECVKEVFPETDKALEELCDTQLRNHGSRWRAKQSTGTPESQKEADKETPENNNEKNPENTNEKPPEKTNEETPQNKNEKNPENPNEKTAENTDQITPGV
ncbi:unnamed protein product [Bemisia tabaci]|uniref:Uncharacterized protein n=1 Tax=Bemisia tabaci TaxID=7038 RepID=A0A9P0C4G9_BEMTA|nr:unnamed protein product [Bemisia tabaci]